MKKALSLLTVAFLISITAFSQSLSGITGQVKDENQKPFAGVNVFLYLAKDTSLIKAVFSDKNGQYSFEGIKESSYLVGVSAVGYQKIYSSPIVLKGTDISVPSFTLAVQVKGLSEVTVQAKKPLFEQKPDKMVVNVDASPSNAGANALEVLEKSPGITVDKDGNISLKGKAGVQVFIDGKPAYLSGADLVNYLRNLSGAQLEQIEIMTNPPAKFDAAGNSGIINIKTKKSKQVGYNVSAQVGYTQGIYARNNQNINFNYRKNKVNLFGNFSRNERTTIQNLDIQRKFFESTTKEVISLFDQNSIMKNWNASNNGKLGADIYLSKNTTIGTVLSGFSNPGEFSNTSDIFISNPSRVLQSKTFARSLSENHWKNFSSNINFRHVFDTTGKELTADLDYITYDATNTQNLSNYYYSELGIPNAKPDTLYGKLPQNIHIYSGKADYLQPMKKGAKLEAGVKLAYVQTDANAIYDSLVNNQLKRDLGRSNHFKYDERIAAAYISYSRPLTKKLSGQFGVRLENTLAHGNQLTTGETFKLDYTQLFPTAYLAYIASEKHSWSLNYGRRIRRPDYESLNPFVEFLDRYTFEQGNPNLRPQFSHNVEVSHTFKGFLTTTLNYTKTNNIIQQVLEQNTDRNETFVKQANIASQRQYGAAVTAFTQIKNFSGSVYVNVYNNQFKGLVNNTFITLDATTAIFNVSGSYKFKKGITAEINGFMRTPGLEGVFNIETLGAVNAGVSFPMFKNKATLRLSARDIFWTQKVGGSSKYGDIDARFQQAPDSRTVGINFTYRLSKGKVNGNKRKTGGADTEQERVKGGNN